MASQNSQILVSICCITYNHEQYICDALDGFVMQQTTFPFEIVISDDCSKDCTRSIIAKYKTKYSNLIRDVSPEKNKGVLANFIYVQQQALGKYIAFCEGDDYWTDPLKLQKQVDFLERNPDYTICFHGSDILNESRRDVTIHCDTIETREYYANDVFPEWVPHMSSFMYRRSVLENCQLRHPEWLESGDTVTVLKCMHMGRAWGMSDHMSVYRMNDYSRMSKPNDVKAIGKYVRHLKCFLLNFPKIDKEYCYLEICSYDYERFKKNDGERNRWYYLFDAVRTSPKYMFKMYKRQLKAFVKKIL